MHKVDRIIEAPAGVAWRILTDTREWPIWGPSVRAVEAPADLIGPGMRGRIQTPVGLWKGSIRATSSWYHRREP
ncbi:MULTISPECIES: hypothetical protein [unclassified Thiocapsa]|uniref:hypothetical protein n=1 Tax=unclassified Thiocapsa TaxID=2641286 RepID=UPI0035B2A7EB